MRSLSFAVGLREENAEDMVSKILPLTKFVPCGNEKEGKKRPKKKAGATEEKPCERIDCSMRKERLVELNSENDAMRKSLKDLESKVAAAKNKFHLTEKSMHYTEDANETLRGQIDDLQTRIAMTESEIDRADIFNKGLRSDLEVMQAEIERLKAKTQNEKSKLTAAIESNNGSGVIFSSSGKSNPTLAAEVSRLNFGTDAQDSDDDDDF